MEYPAFYEEHIRQVVDDYNQARSNVKMQHLFSFSQIYIFI